MTENEPIIIDGVDVSGCDFLAKEDDYCSYSGEYRAYKGECGCSDEEMCKDHPNCFYKKTLKQLARKTQECEGKERDIKHLKKCIDDSFKIQEDIELYWKKENNQLKAENEELKQSSITLATALNIRQQKLERITDVLFTGKCSNCEGYSPNCSNKELCDFKHNIKNIIDEVE